jgi:hypothetical protein
MADRFTDYAQYCAVIANQLRPFGINLAADISQQGIDQIVLIAAAINGDVQAGTDNRLPRHPLRHLAPVAVAQLRQLDVVRVKRFLCRCSE